ncbi:DUF6252 family protein [Myroides indicus]|uniref:Uncharacterized protein n=1 Tax=Myroides indicus TaxID=1323422 RepID=A0A4R7F8H7_9FLAO|nr:DUF6252 family protein [Myroides indicus]TDS62089.1 hypothetical protein C8P70_10758 [Myroides indicus]
MKKIFGILAVALAFVACENDVKFATPGMHAQMTLDAITDTTALNQSPYNRFTEYRPQDFKALVVSGKGLVIEAVTDSTKLMITVPEYEFGTKYEFDKTKGIFAEYFLLDDDEKVIGSYGTDIKGKDEKEIENPGFVIFDVAEKQVPGSISGRFVINMNASLLPPDETGGVGEMPDDIPDGAAVVFIKKKYVDKKSFQDGVFFRIPLGEAK